jgi:hypothetical protein
MKMTNLPYRTVVVSIMPDEAMPYDTVADWRALENGTLVVNHVVLGDPLFEYLLVHHEIDEAQICRMQGIEVSQVDEFDESYERKRPENDMESEPGNESDAPYHFAHTTAEASERVLALALGVVWGDYMKAIEDAFRRVRKNRRGS